ncbi:hypothetical protein K466DRAFT_565641 [Polyporus arcularius HHB13444]|uniref:Uncharacterized protein n=1 Tax=Polyporus arcularius HHB13444 TaxID=1314778 RepID=A0A5C3PLY6_9APHY|nr:hypothetical protein K466DRAFT_565641 [Polyporus arcularius HHB13444]
MSETTVHHSRPSSPESMPAQKRPRDSSGDEEDAVLRELFPGVEPSDALSNLPVINPAEEEELLQSMGGGYASDGSTASARVAVAILFPEIDPRIEEGNDHRNVDTVESLALRAITYPSWYKWNEHLAPADLQRLQALLDVRDGNRFSFGNLPLQATWKNQVLGDESGIFDIIAVGVLDSSCFTAARFPDFQCSFVTLYLLRDLDRQALGRMWEFASPARARSTKFLRAMYQPPTSNSTILFPHVYDATKGFTVKSRMPQIAVSDLVVGDIVLIEGFITPPCFLNNCRHMSDTSDTLTATSENDRMLLWGGAMDDTALATQPWVPTAAFERLPSIGNLPTTVRWGDGLYASYITMQDGTEIPKIWVTGHLASILYMSSENEARPRLRVQIDLLRTADRTRLNDILGMASPPASALSELDYMTLNKMSPSNRTGFRDVFDATMCYTKKASMDRIPITDLMVGDLVLVECAAIRYKADDSPGWTLWQVGFQMHAISVLCRRSETVAPPQLFFSDNFVGTI